MITETETKKMCFTYIQKFNGVMAFVRIRQDADTGKWSGWLNSSFNDVELCNSKTAVACMKGLKSIDAYQRGMEVQASSRKAYFTSKPVTDKQAWDSLKAWSVQQAKIRLMMTDLLKR